MIALAQHLESEILRKINPLPKLIEEDSDLKIAHISFGFDNKAMIDLLKSRGSLITAGKFDKLTAINKKIDKMAEEEADKMQRPVAAFITFETQEGFERAMFYFPPKQDDRETNE